MEDSLANDFLAVWQSELTAMAADRELRETWTAMLAFWAHSAAAVVATLPGTQHDIPTGSTSAPQPAGTAAPGAAPESGLAAIEHLARRVAELEQTLAAYLASQTA